ncbi:MAG: cbb3-type cytochrome oxidase assembly protein CcoS [Kordiimonadaceae bacterium]|jgi:cbb3-type cytochrome oxidase maturation protein|nr:cbb3-type cytochrome oxidase assembly protein CcoS [Kordiimonadaceae bacterium]MBT6032248.1 cbb3-type cytochrome oxidase assembly protein CcoS [Kordiimonadaceae bacterium]
MDGLVYLIPAALFLGLIGLVAFMWTINRGQYDDLDGATYRALFEEDDIEEENNLKEDKATSEATTSRNDDDNNKQSHKS